MLVLSRLHTQPVPAPVNACHNPLRGNSHDSEASVVRYSFTARDLHPRLLAGLCRRFGQSQFFASARLAGFFNGSTVPNFTISISLAWLLQFSLDRIL